MGTGTGIGAGAAAITAVVGLGGDGTGWVDELVGGLRFEGRDGVDGVGAARSSLAASRRFAKDSSEIAEGESESVEEEVVEWG
jgi:hypothetical protein